MRGELDEDAGMFSYITPAQRVPKDHPLRAIRVLVDAALKEMSPVFQRLYSRIGRPSKVSSPSKTPVSPENPPKTGGSSSPGRRVSAQ